MDAQTEIERGIAAAQAGNQRTAYYYFNAATRADPTNEQAWLWRASAAPRPEEALNCLAAVLAINPDNPVARHGLEQISAAITAGRDQLPEVIVPSQGAQALSFQPPERRLAWQQAFQRDHYDPARVAHLAPQGDERRPAPPPVGALAAPRPADPIRPEERRQPMDRPIMRRRLILATAVPVVLVLALAYIVGLQQYAPAVPGIPTLMPPGRTPAAALSATPLPPTLAVVNPTVPPADTVPPATTVPPAADTPVPPPPGTDTPVPPPPATDTPPPAPPPTDTPAPPPVSGEEIYTVVAGDTLQAIAGRLGRTLAAMMVFNNLTHPFDIQAGQVLKVPPAAFKPAEVRHRVLPGETLIGIASLYGANVAAIVQANGLSDQNRIFAGQEIIIPLP